MLARSALLPLDGYSTDRNTLTLNQETTASLVARLVTPLLVVFEGRYLKAKPVELGVPNMETLFVSGERDLSHKGCKDRNACMVAVVAALY